MPQIFKHDSTAMSHKWGNFSVFITVLLVLFNVIFLLKAIRIFEMMFLGMELDVSLRLLTIKLIFWTYIGILIAWTIFYVKRKLSKSLIITGYTLMLISTLFILFMFLFPIWEPIGYIQK